MVVFGDDASKMHHNKRCTRKIALENSRHLATPTLFSPRSDVSDTSAENFERERERERGQLFLSKLAYITKKWFPLGAGKFHTDDASLPRFG